MLTEYGKNPLFYKVKNSCRSIKKQALIYYQIKKSNCFVVCVLNKRIYPPAPGFLRIVSLGVIAGGIKR